jgi:hypothetical protein
MSNQNQISNAPLILGIIGGILGNFSPSNPSMVTLHNIKLAPSHWNVCPLLASAFIVFLSQILRQLEEN